MRRHTTRSLTALFTSIVSFTACGVSACGGAVDDRIDTSQFESSLCAGTAFPHASMDLRPGTAADVVELRAVEGYSPPGSAPFTVVSTSGTPCKTATNVDACNHAFAASPSSPSTSMLTFGAWGNGVPTRYYVITTRGDEVQTYGDASSLRALLTPIDTPDEAALVASASLAGHSVDCTVTKNAHATKDGGFEIVTRTGTGCGDDIVQHLVTVSSDGTATVVQDSVIQKGDPHCAIGRRPEGLLDARGPRKEGVGALFARIARLEAASIPAFRRLADDLRAHARPSPSRDDASARRTTKRGTRAR